MREIKFKFWLGHIKKMTYEHTLTGIAFKEWDFTDDIIPLQFTGLKDKNGKEIYEGDIMDYGHGRFKPVEFIDGSFCICKINTMPKLMTLYPIVGNIYEHSHLLEKVTP